MTVRGDFHIENEQYPCLPSNPVTQLLIMNSGDISSMRESRAWHMHTIVDAKNVGIRKSNI